jgi:hypothetical protein
VAGDHGQVLQLLVVEADPPGGHEAGVLEEDALGPLGSMSPLDEEMANEAPSTRVIEPPDVFLTSRFAVEGPRIVHAPPAMDGFSGRAGDEKIRVTGPAREDPLVQGDVPVDHPLDREVTFHVAAAVARSISPNRPSAWTSPASSGERSRLRHLRRSRAPRRRGW